MKYFRLALIAISALPLSLPVGVSAQEPADENRGELHIYDTSTSAGTVAHREFKDSKGRIIKSILYGGGGSTPPYREELLTEYMINLATYGADDCVVKSESYWPGMKLRGTVETQCWPGTSTAQVMTFRNARGKRTQETRNTDEGSEQTVIFFDASGEKVVGFKGQTPTDFDLMHGWGEEAGGFVCGIAANLDRGRQDDIEISGTIKNISFKEDRLAAITVVAIELRDSSGHLIRPKAEIAAEEAKVPAGACPPGGSGGSDVGESDPLWGYRLGERYDRLAPGKYEMTIKLCSPISGPLVSNTIVLEIVAPK